MAYLSEKIGEGISWVASSGWSWFGSLSREEWVVVLAVGCACGFLCLRGFGSRANY